MKNIFLNLTKYWYLVLAILLLLFIQAYCDLSLPDYTSELIDVGISNSGVEHSVPEYISEKGFAEVTAFMNEEELSDWQDIYSYDEELGYYILKDEKNEDMDALDEEFSNVIAIAYMINSRAESEDVDLSAVDMSAVQGMDMSQIDTSPMIFVWTNLILQ